MSRLARLIVLPAGRRAKFVVLGIWLVVLAAAGPVAGKLESAEKNEPASFLPGKAESVRALDTIKRYERGTQTPAIVVYRHADGLTAAQRAAVGADRAELLARPPRGVVGVSAPVLSRDGTAALLVVPIRAGGKSSVLEGAVTKIRTLTHRARGGGLQVEVSGPAGFSTDAIKVFGRINSTLLLATALLVFVLLILIYRSPIFWVIPLLSVALAEVAARAAGYGLAEAGVTVNGQSAGILPVLVFGAGTDYALLLVARYREELRRHDSKHEAMALALRRAGPAIVASGLTVTAGLLCLTLAEVNATSGLGPIGAMGILFAMVSMLTLLPALLLVAGRRAFWPYVPRVGGEGADETHGAWRRVGERVMRRPRRVWVGATAVLLILCLGLTSFSTKLTQGNSFRDTVESKRGQQLLDNSFPAGANAPVDVIVPAARSVGAVRAALARAPGVAQVQARTVPLGPGARFQLALASDPYSRSAFDRISALRRVAKRAGGSGTLIGGPTAEEHDQRVSAARDTRLIIPVVLAVVFLILAVLLRAVAAPLLLIGSVILSFAASLGVGAFTFEHVFGFPGVDPSFPLLAFIFLVALGVDYNIFLMARVREESERHGTRHGMLRGLAVTGAVITSAGIVLAGTFSTLAVLPLVFLTEIGFVIAFGVLLDALLVRSVLVPALVFDLGGRVWWPSRLARRGEPPGEDGNGSRGAQGVPEAPAPPSGRTVVT